MSGEENLIVDVEELKTCASNINSVCHGLDDVVTSLIQHLQTASATGLESGLAAEAFVTFVNEISRLKGKLGDSGNDTSTAITNYLDAIDQADDLLFENSGYKPFTDEEFRACFSVVENTTSLSLDVSLDSWFSNLLDKLMKFIWKLAGIEVTVNTDSSILVGKVDNLKEQTIEKLSTIKAEVRSADRTYRQVLSNYLAVFKAYGQALQQIDVILTSDSGVVDATGLITLSEILDQYEIFIQYPEVVTDEDVKCFTDNVTDYFGSSTAVIGAVCAASIGQLVTSEFDEYRATVNAALDYFNSYSSNYSSSLERYKKYKDTFDEILKIYNKYGNNWTDYYEGSKENVEMFNKLIKRTGEISKKADNYVDIWFQLFCDMSESQEAFARFKANCDLNNEGVLKALERVEALYRNEVDEFVYETLEDIFQVIKKEGIENGAEAVAKVYANIVPNGGMEQIMTKVAANILSKAYAEAPAVAQYDWVLATQNSFDNAVANLKAAIPGSTGYDKLVQTVREAFDAAKQARITFFNTMAEHASGQQKRFYELNIESLKTMSLDDVTRHNAITPGEYFGENANIFGYIIDGDVTASF